MDEADDVVRRPTNDRVSRVRQVAGHLDRLVDGQGGIEEVHLGPRAHHLAHLTVGGGEHVLDDLALPR